MDILSPSPARRHFLKTIVAAGAASLGCPLLAAGPEPKIKVGMDNFAVRALGWKAPQLIDFAASIRCDTLFISDLDAYESLEEPYLRDIKAKADAAGLALYVGSWSICPTSNVFKNKWGTAGEHIALGLRVARALGSPVFRAVLGNMADRKSEGGIRARIADTVKVLKASRSRVLDSGIKLSIENHGGDMHSWELVDLVEEAGPDFVGVNIDSGNAAWTLEDPHDVLENLGKFTNCSSLRDEMIWETPDGAAVQWTAVGEGLIDWPRYVARWRQLCPAVPIQIETISGSLKMFPYKTEEFWKHYDKHPEALAHFEALAKKGHALEPIKLAPGADKEFQKSEITRSIKYLRETLGLGEKG